MSLDYSIIGERLKKARKDKKLTQEQLAEKLDVSVAFLSRVERGDVKINLPRLNQVCDILDISISYILTGSGSNSKNYLNEDLAEIDNFPNALYAFWRSNTENSETNEGILKNADKFMDNFFANNLGKVCPLLISYNYRSKYFKSNEQNEYIPRDFEKFNGTRLNYTREWLNGRLHILDDYFNLNTAVSNII